jgi:hypothetical protein
MLNFFFLNILRLFLKLWLHSVCTISSIHYKISRQMNLCPKWDRSKKWETEKNLTRGRKFLSVWEITKGIFYQFLENNFTMKRYWRILWIFEFHFKIFFLLKKKYFFFLTVKRDKALSLYINGDCDFFSRNLDFLKWLLRSCLRMYVNF